MSDMNYCNQCENKCLVTDLKCGRGRRYFAEMQGEKKEDDDGAERHGYEGSHRHEERRGHGGRHRREENQGREERNNREDRHSYEDEHEHCGRRHEHGYGRDLDLDMRRVPDGDNLYDLLRACGHYLHHNFQGHHSVEEENALFNALDESEKEKLQELLKQLVDSWK